MSSWQSRSFWPKILPKPSWGGVGGLGSVVCCTQVGCELECARSPHIPEELELLHACGEPVSWLESLMDVMGTQKSQELLLKALPLPQKSMPAAGPTSPVL